VGEIKRKIGPKIALKLRYLDLFLDSSERNNSSAALAVLSGENPHLLNIGRKTAIGSNTALHCTMTLRCAK
jgi:hypothetical protein